MKTKLLVFFVLLCGSLVYAQDMDAPSFELMEANEAGVFLVVLGTTQDGGSPHVGCKKDCCEALFDKEDYSRKVVSLGLLDAINSKKYLFEATPDISKQMKMLKIMAPFKSEETPDGIFLTHAHIGHYTGLMYLGKEALNSDKLPVYAMPKMTRFLEKNGPWNQLISNDNIKLVELENTQVMKLSQEIVVTPIEVPHRDEYSETVGYLIEGPSKKALFIPDIDKWAKWEMDILDKIKEVDYAFLDATFYDAEELDNRDIASIPHPFLVESMKQFEHLEHSERSKVHFIHFNHTNPVLDPFSEASKKVLAAGFNIARINEVYPL